MVGISSILGQSQSVGVSCVRIPNIRRPKLDPTANKCAFLGFSKDSDACRFLDRGTNSIIEARYAELFEDKFIKDKGLSKMYLKILKNLLHQINQSLQKQKVLMLKKKLQKL